MTDQAALLLPSIFARRYWPDGPPKTPLPDPTEWETLPTVNGLRSPAIASIKLHRSIYDIGWNGTWVKAFACAAPGELRQYPK